MMKKTIILILLGLWSVTGQTETPADNFTERHVTFAETEAKIIKAKAVLEEMAQSPDQGVPATLLHQAKAIAVIPNLIEAGLLVAAKVGRGILVVRNETKSWSAPVFITSTGGSFGLQAGAQSSDIILVFKDRTGVEKMVDRQFTLGVDAAVAAGPVGRSAEASTDVQFASAIYSYSRSAGLFAGISLEGSALEIDHLANRAFYRQAVTPKAIFSGQVSINSTAVKQLNTALNQYTNK